MINEFKGDYRFLSNFFKTDVLFEGIVYPSSEHAYMAAKTTCQDTRAFIATITSPADAKSFGRSIGLRDNWDALKFQFMYQIIMDKFSRNGIIRKKLLDTGDQQLVEGNWWGDKIWGYCLKTNQGENNLGKVLMRVRDELRQAMPVKLIIAGGRDFKDIDLMRNRLQAMEDNGLFTNGVELVCGMARGADNLGYEIFKQAGLPILTFPADWDSHGKRAGFIRNAEMGNIADLSLIFWDGQSRGTKHMIEYMEKLNKPVYLVTY